MCSAEPTERRTHRWLCLSLPCPNFFLDALTDRERGVDLVRELAEYLAQELIEVQAAQAIGARRYERSDGRVTERNGHRDRVPDHEGR